MTPIRLDAIAFDAGTQVRAALDQQVVTDYAEAMTAGAQFPPIVLFHDGNQHYLADGFHRFMAAQRNQWREIDADVRAGTKEDALWFALGANKTNGARMTPADIKHAVELTLQSWPDMSGQRIAAQIGCSASYVSRIKSVVSTRADLPERVVGSDGRTYPASPSARQRARDNASKLLREGRSVEEVREATGIGRDVVTGLRRQLGLAVDKTRAGVQERIDTIRHMAAEGHTSRQIAAATGLSEDGCRNALKREGIDVPADKVTRGTHRHDSNRILERIVMDAENLTEGANLIDFSDIDRAKLGEWIDSLIASRRALDTFIKRLTKEKTRDGEAS